MAIKPKICVITVVFNPPELCRAGLRTLHLQLVGLCGDGCCSTTYTNLTLRKSNLIVELL